MSASVAPSVANSARPLYSDDDLSEDEAEQERLMDLKFGGSTAGMEDATAERKRAGGGAADESLQAEANELAEAAGRKVRRKLEVSDLAPSDGAAGGLFALGKLSVPAPGRGGEGGYAGRVVGGVAGWCKDVFPGLHFEDLLMRV
ncbi:hypothetical protein TeGR_g2575, partial [Tetraparma gracilis]